jgi:hypothetical protein
MPDASFRSQPRALGDELARVARLNAERQAEPALAAGLGRLARFQAQRLRRTYADLAAQPRYAAAIDFFERDLYGGTDFARRDADLARVVPVMTQMLPENVIATIAEGVELNGLSQELDRALLAKLPRIDRFGSADYCSAYRRMGNRGGRERQVELIAKIGTGLDRCVSKPFIRTALKLMRRPARMAGLGVLQDFLERGFAAFHDMHGAAEFLATIDKRERALMSALFAGETVSFPEPEAGS